MSTQDIYKGLWLPGTHLAGDLKPAFQPRRVGSGSLSMTVSEELPHPKRQGSLTLAPQDLTAPFPGMKSGSGRSVLDPHFSICEMGVLVSPIDY